MTNLKIYTHRYAFDKGLNLIQKSASASSKVRRMITAQANNRAIREGQYTLLNLTPSQKANLSQALLDKGVFDSHGNQIKPKTGQVLGWNYRNMLQTTATEQEDSTLKEYNVHGKAGQRNRKVTEKTNKQGDITEITEALYLGNLEYRTTWQGENLTYDGEVVIEQSTGQQVSPYGKDCTLRILQGHKQVAQKRVHQYQAGVKVTEQATAYSLDNNIDSCELTLNKSGDLESYESYKPYGQTAISYGKTEQQPYKYSGQEKDNSGLYYYGFRSLDPETSRWVSPDPAGLQGSGLNWYAMVSGNPITVRDIYGLGKGIGEVFRTFNMAFRKASAYDMRDVDSKYEACIQREKKEIPTDDHLIARAFRTACGNLILRKENNSYGEVLGPGWGQNYWEGNARGKFNWTQTDSLFYTDWLNSNHVNPEHRIWKQIAFPWQYHNIVGNHESGKSWQDIDGELFRVFRNTITNAPGADFFGSVDLRYYKPDKSRHGLTGAYHPQTNLFIMAPMLTPNVHNIVLDHHLNLGERGRANSHREIAEMFIDAGHLMHIIPSEETRRDFVGFTGFYEEGKFVVEMLSYAMNTGYNFRHDPELKGKGASNFNRSFRNQPSKKMQLTIAQTVSNHLGIPVQIRPPQYRKTVRFPGVHTVYPEKK